ncbi:MAG: hypothetical protein ACRDJN_06720 [Chloroflexota bacterium]
MSEWTLWFGLLAGHTAWSLQLMVGYFLTSLACEGAFPGFWIALHAVTVVTAGLTLAAGVLAFRSWRLAQTATQEGRGRAGGGGTRGGVGEGGNAGQVMDPDRRSRFMALSGVLLSGLYLFVVLMGGAANFFVSPCV